MKELKKELRTVDDYLNFFTQLSFSKSYCLKFGEWQQQENYQEYSKLNEQHLYDVTDFLQDKEKKDKIIELKTSSNDVDKIIYIVK